MKTDNNENIKIIDAKNSSSENLNKEYINKINEQEKYIKELELKIKEKDRIINKEKKKLKI